MIPIKVGSVHGIRLGYGGGENAHQYAPNATGWVDPHGLLCWAAAKKAYWKAKAVAELMSPTGKYSPKNIDAMSRGNAPSMLARVRLKDGSIVERSIPMELHHTYLPQRCGSEKANEAWNLTEATPWGHASMDKYRYPGMELIKIIKGTNGF